MKVFWRQATIAVATGALLAGCGGGGDSSTPATATGVFVDAPVEGIKYVFGSYSGLTGAGGTFTYKVGTKGKFKVGNIVIGEAVGAAAITPVDLVKSAKPTLNNTQAQTEAVKIVQFLMTLDDGSKSGTITIPSAVMTAAADKSADLLTDDLQTVVTSVKNGATLVDSTTASNHLTTSLSGIDKAKYAGRYVAASSSIDFGVDILVLADGSFKGVIAETSGDVFDIVGLLDASGNVTGTVYLYGTNTVQGTITGKVDLLGNMVINSSGGTDFFKRTTPLLTPYIGLYGGSFTGTSGSGDWGVLILGDNKVLGYANPSGGAKETCSGTITTTGTISVSCSGGARGTGTVSGSTASGTWTEGNMSGTWTGSRLVTTK